MGCTCGQGGGAALPPGQSAAAAAAVSPDMSRPAPSRAVAGLVLGHSAENDVAAWVTGNALNCVTAASPRRRTTRTQCTEPPSSIFEGRSQVGTIEHVLVVRPDDGPVHFLSSRRVYAAGPEARLDYEAARQALSSVNGAPTVDGPAPDPLDTQLPLLRYSTQWSYSDLEVKLTLLKTNEAELSISETWTIPGVEAATEARENRKADGSSGASKGSSP